MSKLLLSWLNVGLLFSALALADTPAPGTVKLKGGTDGTLIGNSGDALKTTATISGSVSVSNFPATQPVSGSLGRTWTLLESTDAVTSYQGGSWSVGVNNFPSSFDVNVTNSALPAAGGRSAVAIARNDYSSSNVTTSAYVELVASTSDVINQLDVFDSSGRTLVFAVGGSGSEVDQFNIVPGGNGVVPLRIPAGSRISVKAVSGTANSGELDISFFK